jgi:prepilin-type N-terminal cleavage/methylation domain-containing protein
VLHRAVAGRSQAGFTLVELLAVIAIVSTLTALLPAVQRMRSLAIEAQSANLPATAASLANFANGTDRIFADQAALSSDAANAGDNGTLAQQNLQADLQLLCEDLQNSGQSAATTLARIKQRLAQRPLKPREKQVLLAAEAAVINWNDNVPHVIAAIGPVLASGCSSTG